MKKMKKLSLFIILGFIFVAFVISCIKREGKCETCNAKSTTTTIATNLNEPAIVGKFIAGSPNVSYFQSTITNINSILNSYALTLPVGDIAIGLALYYSGTVDTNNLVATIPVGITVYKSSGSRFYAQLYKKQGNSWIISPTCWGITTKLALNTAVEMIGLGSLSCQNMVVLKSTSFPTVSYMSDFETRGNAQRPSKCGICNTQTEGTCDDAGGGNYACSPKSICIENSTEIILTSNGNPVSPNTSTQLYSTRDLFLVLNKKRAEFIDDYYYSCFKIGTLIDLPLSLKAYAVYQSNLIRKMANMTNPTYADTILITSSEKTKVLNLCTLAKTYSTDTRYRAIIDTVTANLNRFFNKKISYVNSNI